MKRAILSLVAAALAISPVVSQDFGIQAVPGGPGGGALTSQMLDALPTNRGAVGALASSGPSTFGFGAGFGSTDVAAGDFNGDGVGDIAVTQGGAAGGTLTIYSGQGDGTFGLPLSINVMNGPTAIATGDLNLDGLTDVAVGGMDFPTDPSGQLQIFSGAHLSEGIPSANPTAWLDGPVTSLSIGQISGTASPDIAVGLAYGDGSGGLQTLSDFPQTFPEYDYNADFTARTGKTYLAGANNTRFFESAATDVNVMNGGGIAVGQIGGVTMFTPSGLTQALGLSQVGSTDFSAFEPAFGGGVQVAAGDFNNDGIDDLFTLNGMTPPGPGGGAGPGLGVFMGGVDGTFKPSLNLPLNTLPGNSLGAIDFRSPLGNPVVGDFNGDGSADLGFIGSTGTSNGIGILNGNGSGSFLPGPTLPLTAWPALQIGGFDSAVIGGVPRVFAPENAFTPLPILGFCGSNPGSCGGNGLRLPNEQTGVSAGTEMPLSPIKAGFGNAAARERDLVWRLNRFLGGLMTDGRPHALASARYSVFATVQMRAQVEPKQVIITATGQSSGDFFKMEIIDSTGVAHRGSLPDGVVLEPVALPPVTPDAGARVVTQNVDGFCMDFAKEVPKAGTRYRIANAAAQAQAAPMRNVLAAAKQMAVRNLLHTDGTAGYANFVRQYAVWAKREGWDIKKFGESFVSKTKQNVVAMKATWTDVMEQGVRAAIPGRWRDIEEVLRLSNQIATAPARPSK